MLTYSNSNPLSIPIRMLFIVPPLFSQYAFVRPSTLLPLLIPPFAFVQFLLTPPSKTLPPNVPSLQTHSHNFYCPLPPPPSLHTHSYALVDPQSHLLRIRTLLITLALSPIMHMDSWGQ